MRDFHLSVEVEFISVPASTDEQFEAFLDELLANFEKIGREVHLAAKFTAREADIASTVEAEDFESAVNTLLVDLRTTLHMAGAITANWPRFEAKGRVVRELQDA